jgi:mRNA interferase MazF
VAGITQLTRGGVYLARLDPVKGAEVGRLTPVVVLTDQALLDVSPPHVFVCPLTGQYDPDYQALHVSLPARDSLKVSSYALVEHCRAISTRRLLSDRLAKLEIDEINEIIRRLHRLVGW